MSMILYNYRYRGPYEYDKFVNNILQFFNETKLLEDKFFKQEYSQIQERFTELDDLINSLTGEHCRLQQQFLISEQIGG